MCLWDPVEVVDEAFSDMDGHAGGTGTVSTELDTWVLNGLNGENTDACRTMWCVYVPPGTYGVGGSSVGMVYMYRNSSRPSGPPYVTSNLVAGFELDSSDKYGSSWPKTLPITDMGTGSGVSGGVSWSGGMGYTTLLPGCSAYRLQIPFKLRPEESSSSSFSSQSSSSTLTSGSSASSQTLCGSNFVCSYGSVMPFGGGINTCSLFVASGIVGVIPFNFYVSIPEIIFDGLCMMYGKVHIMTSGSYPNRTNYIKISLYNNSEDLTLFSSVVQAYASINGSTWSWLFTEGWLNIIGNGALGMPTGVIGRAYLRIPPSLAVILGGSTYVEIGNFDLRSADMVYI